MSIAEVPTTDHTYRAAEFIETYTGRAFYPLDPDPSAVSIIDIAHGLSLQCRYGGQITSFYSVAQHCVLLAVYAENVLKASALDCLQMLMTRYKAEVADAKDKVTATRGQIASGSGGLRRIFVPRTSHPWLNRRRERSDSLGHRSPPHGARGRTAGASRGRGASFRRRGDGGAPEAGDRAAEARSVRCLIGTRPQAARSKGTATGGAGDGCERGGGEGARHRGDDGSSVHSPQTGSRTAAGPPAARTCGRSRSDCLSLLRRQTRQTW